jgi:hypothetical protein
MQDGIPVLQGPVVLKFERRQPGEARVPVEIRPCGRADRAVPPVVGMHRTGLDPVAAGHRCSLRPETWIALERTRSFPNLYVHSLDEEGQRLRSRGARVLRDPGDMPWGECIATVADWDGGGAALCETSDTAARPGAQ